MDEFLKKLEELYSEERPVSTGDDGSIYFNDDDDVVRDCENLACEYLISAGGCNWKNIRVLKENYDVFPGERDSFGWITGCIRKNGDRRILVYG